jgi:hypothetical protein
MVEESLEAGSLEFEVVTFAFQLTLSESNNLIG